MKEYLEKNKTKCRPPSWGFRLPSSALVAWCSRALDPLQVCTIVTRSALLQWSASENVVRYKRCNSRLDGSDCRVVPRRAVSDENQTQEGPLRAGRHDVHDGGKKKGRATEPDNWAAVQVLCVLLLKTERECACGCRGKWDFFFPPRTGRHLGKAIYAESNLQLYSSICHARYEEGQPLFSSVTS